MVRIGISQRVQVVEGRGERRDCLDQRWSQLMDAGGFLGIALSNAVADPRAYLEALMLDGIILSGGNNIETLGDVPDIASERDALERAALDWAAARRLPVLGVCRGMQMINDYCGGQLRQLADHVATRHGLKAAGADALLPLPGDVNSFHDYGIGAGDVAAPLRVLASADDGSVEAVRHQALPWLGIMWHPEREPSFRREELTLLHNLFGAER